MTHGWIPLGPVTLPLRLAMGFKNGWSAETTMNLQHQYFNDRAGTRLCRNLQHAKTRPPSAMLHILSSCQSPFAMNIIWHPVILPEKRSGSQLFRT